MVIRKQPEKGNQKKDLVDTPLEQLGEKETLMHYNAVLLEDIKSKISFIVESLEATRLEFGQRLTAVQTEIDSLRDRTDRRFAQMERTLHSLKDDIVDLEHRTSSRFDSLSSRCNSFEGRLAALGQA